MVDWQIQPLIAAHDRAAFACGKPPLDDFLRKLASQYQKRRLGRTYVATLPGETRVLGYYTLAAGSFDVSCLPESSRKKLPQHPLPTVHLGRLAVDSSAHGQGLGETLLFHALRTALDISTTLGAFAADVFAIDEEARRFYEKYGFQSLEAEPRHLYLALKTIEAIFAVESL